MSHTAITLVADCIVSTWLENDVSDIGKTNYTVAIFSLVLATLLLAPFHFIQHSSLILLPKPFYEFVPEKGFNRQKYK